MAQVPHVSSMVVPVMLAAALASASLPAAAQSPAGDTGAKRDRRLYNIVSMATRYRTILSEQIQALRAGKDSETVRAALTRWQVILRDIKKLAADL